MPRKPKNPATMRLTYAGSWKAEGRKNFFLRGGRRALMATEAGRRRARMMKPTTRMVQPKPKLVWISILLMAIGRTTPPREDPAMPSPMAVARFLLKY